MQQQDGGPSTTEGLKQGWTAEQRVSAGQIAAEALNSPIFNVIHDLMMQKYFREMQVSEPKEENTRRSLYYEMRALKSVMLEMASLVTDAQAIVQRAQQENDPAEKERRRLDEQGYGLNFNQEMSNG